MTSRYWTEAASATSSSLQLSEVSSLRDRPATGHISPTVSSTSEEHHSSHPLLLPNTSLLRTQPSKYAGSSLVHSPRRYGFRRPSRSHRHFGCCWRGCPRSRGESSSEHFAQHWSKQRRDLWPNHDQLGPKPHQQRLVEPTLAVAYQRVPRFPSGEVSMD